MPNHDPDIQIEFSPQHSEQIYSRNKSLADFAQLIQAGEQISFILYPLSKTLLSTHFNCGFGGQSMNLDLEGFKLDSQHRFKLLKTQGAEAYQRYIKAVIGYLEQQMGIKISQRKFVVYTHVFQ